MSVTIFHVNMYRLKTGVFNFFNSGRTSWYFNYSRNRILQKYMYKQQAYNHCTIKKFHWFYCELENNYFLLYTAMIASLFLSFVQLLLLGLKYGLSTKCPIVCRVGFTCQNLIYIYMYLLVNIQYAWYVKLYIKTESIKSIIFFKLLKVKMFYTRICNLSKR